MVSIPPKYVIDSTLKVGTIYKFNAPELINTTEPHFFIVVAIEDLDNYLVLCTSQDKKKEKYFTNNNLDFSGLVYIKPDSDNGLCMNTYVNCNDYYTITKSSLIKKCNSKGFKLTGTLSLNHYEQIKTGIIKSHTNDLPENILEYPMSDI